MKKNTLILLCTLFHGVLWSQIGIYKIEGDLEVTGDAQTDGEVNVGSGSPIGVMTIHYPSTIGGNWGDGVTGFSEGALVLHSVHPNVDNQMMALDSNQIISNVKLHVGSTHDIAFHAGGVPRLTLEDTGKIGLGTETPDYNFHLAATSPAIQLLESTSNTTAYSGAWTYYKVPTNDPNMSITAVGHSFAGSADASQFVIAQRNASGGFIGNLLVYHYGLNTWRFRPNNVHVFSMAADQVVALKPFTAEEGLEVTNGLTADSITLGGVTHTEWPISPAPIVDPVSFNFDVGANTSWTGTNTYSTTFGHNSEIDDSSYVVHWGENNTTDHTTNATAWGKQNVLDSANYGTAWGIDNEINSSSIGTAWGMSQTLTATNYSTAWGFQNSISSCDFSTVWGSDNLIVSDYSTTWGLGNISLSYLSTVFGRFSTYDGNHHAGDWIATEPLLLVGNGTDDLNRSNALELLKSGDMTVSGTFKASKGVVLDNGAEAAAGAIRWTGTDFEGHNGTDWKPLSESNTVNGDISMGDFQ